MPNLLSSATQILLILTIANMVGLLLLSVVWRRRDVSFAEFLLKGSFIYRDIEKYIRNDRVMPFMALSYSGVLLFMTTIISALF